MPTLLDTVAEVREDAGGLHIVRQQDISQDFLDSLHNEREFKRHNRTSEMHRVASIPTQVIDVWLRQGRDFYNATPRQVVQWLEADNLQAFIATSKRV